MLRRLASALALVSATTPLVAGCSSDTVDVYMALDADGARKRTTFYTDTDAIVCIAEVPAGKGGTTVNAVIRRVYDGSNRVDDVIYVAEQVPQSQSGGSGAPKVAFTVTKPANDGGAQQDEPWPVGAFQCEITVDGTLKGVAPFKIEIPDCPLYPVTQGTRCSGFYSAGTTCKAADQSVSYTCDGNTGVWQ
jgi:hypothetical protein